jgi:hypothetical protein
MFFQYGKLGHIQGHLSTHLLNVQNSPIDEKKPPRDISRQLICPEVSRHGICLDVSSE